MWPTCLILRKQSSSSKRLPPPAMGSSALSDRLISADPVTEGAESLYESSASGGGNDGSHHRKRTRRHVRRVYRKTEGVARSGCCRSAGTVRCERRHSQALR